MANFSPFYFTAHTFAAPGKAQAYDYNNSLFFVGSKEYTSGQYVYQMDVAPFIENGRTYVPIRYLAHALGMTEENIDWFAPLQTVTFHYKGNDVSVGIGKKILLVNTIVIEMDVAPIIRYNRVFFPARYVAEAFGETVSWEPETNGVLISKNNSQPIIAPPVPPYSPNPTTPIDHEDKTPIQPYVWEYGGTTWTWAPKIPQYVADTVLEDCRLNMPHPHRNALDYVSTYCTEEKNLRSLEGLADVFKKGAIKEGLSEYEIPCLVIAFVQSFPYVSDSISSGYDEYPRYPIETLVARKGDCEDTAILTATLLKQLKYDTALIFLPGHCAVGIWGKDEVGGTYFLVNGKRYYYLETTDVGWKVGEIPDILKDKQAIVLPLP